MSSSNGKGHEVAPSVSKSTDPVALALKNAELEKELYEIEKKGAKRLFCILIGSLIGNALLLYVAFIYFPRSDYVATTNTAAVCTIPPISQPSIHPRTVADFAMDAVVGVYSYDHVNYKRQITSVANDYFTESYRNQFMVAFGDSQNLKTVIENFYVVTATSAGRPPQIVRNGLRDGAYFWTVQVPVNVYYVSGRKTQEEKLLAEVTVSRVQPSRLNPRGIAISGINTRQLLR